MSSVVDSSSPAEIKAAIMSVQADPQKRSEVGIKALWALFRAPDRTLPHDQLVTEFKAPEWHFGWFCKRVAEDLGDNDPTEYALTDRWTAPDGRWMLRLKPSVVKAMSG